MPDTPPVTFEIYVHDDRYAVPTLHLLAAADEGAAREMIDGLMRETAHHLGAELWRGGEILHRTGSQGTRHYGLQAASG